MKMLNFVASLEINLKLHGPIVEEITGRAANFAMNVIIIGVIRLLKLLFDFKIENE